MKLRAARLRAAEGALKYWVVLAVPLALAGALAQVVPSTITSLLCGLLGPVPQYAKVLQLLAR
jgi:hypothetical protein